MKKYAYSILMSFLVLIMSSCSKQLQSNSGGLTDISLSRNSSEYSLKRINTIEMKGTSLFGIPGFGSNNKNKNKYGLLFRFNGINIGRVPRALPILTMLGTTLLFGIYGQEIAGINRRTGEYVLPDGVNYLVALPVAGIANNYLWQGSAVSGITNQIHYKLINENPNVDMFTNPKYSIDYKYGLFGQKATVKLDVIGATLNIK